VSGSGDLTDKDDAMTYRGIVKVGGTPDVHELAKLIVTKVAVGPFETN
jgi:hypothetical protein